MPKYVFKNSCMFYAIFIFIASITILWKDNWMILKNFFQQTLNWCSSYIRNTEKKIRKIRSLKVYSNLK